MARAVRVEAGWWCRLVMVEVAKIKVAIVVAVMENLIRPPSLPVRRPRSLVVL